MYGITEYYTILIILGYNIRLVVDWRYLMRFCKLVIISIRM